MKYSNFLLRILKDFILAAHFFIIFSIFDKHLSKTPSNLLKILIHSKKTKDFSKIELPDIKILITLIQIERENYYCQRGIFSFNFPQHNKKSKILVIILDFSFFINQISKSIKMTSILQSYFSNLDGKAILPSFFLYFLQQSLKFTDISFEEFYDFFCTDISNKTKNQLYDIYTKIKRNKEYNLFFFGNGLNLSLAKSALKTSQVKSYKKKSHLFIQNFTVKMTMKL